MPPTPSPKPTDHDFSMFPDPDTVPPEVLDKILDQRWLQEAIRLHDMGITLSPEKLKKMSELPGAQGFDIEEFEFQPGVKSRAYRDRATGEMVPKEKVQSPDFTPIIRELKHPRTGAPLGLAMQTSPNSAVPYEDPETAPVEQTFYPGVAAKVANPDGSERVIGNYIKGPDGKTTFVKEEKSTAESILEFSRVQKEIDDAEAARKANPNAKPPERPKLQPPAFIIKNDNDYSRIPSGSRFVGPDGKIRVKP